MSNVPVVTVPTIAIEGSNDRFPVRRIFCVGQNYAEHAREMGADPDRAPPFFFTKPADAVVSSGTTMPFPSRTDDLHHEVELVVGLASGGSDIPIADAIASIFGWTVGIDLTRRDMQAIAKKAGRPWDMAKGFDGSAPVGSLRIGAPPTKGAIALDIDGERRQSGDLSEMIWSVAEIIATLSTYVALAPGDLIFTGTPAGVGAIRPGETVTGSIGDTTTVAVSFASL
jgi:fumarylpyruvate hydrolase